MPQVSVIVPAYRVTAYIKEAVDSVLAQTFEDFEIIVVNDGCPDTEALERVLEPYRSRISYLKLEKNVGLASARNAGILASKSQYIALLDADDLLEPKYLEVQLRILEADPTIDILYCDGRIFGDSPAAGRTTMELNPSEGEVTFASLVSLKCNVAVQVTGRKEIFLKAGLFEDGRRRVEDFDMWLRVIKAGGRIAYHRGVLVRSRRRGDSLSASEEAMLLADIEVCEKARRTLQLTTEELDAMDRQIIRWRAQLDLARGKQALDSGRMEDAALHLGRASAYFKTPRLAVIAAMARIAPRLLSWAHGRRTASG
jgi:glycosyltransferase involved in cell wall biosynthesis